DLRLGQLGQLVDGAYHAAQGQLQLSVGTGDHDALGAGDGGLLGALRQVDAELLELRVAAEGIEARDGKIELAADAAQELVAVAGPGVDDGTIVLDDLLQVA